METLINELANYQYSPKVNVFLVYVLGAMAIAHFQTQKNKLNLNEMTDDEIYFNVRLGFIDDQGRPTAKYTYYQILVTPGIGLVNDMIVQIFGQMFGASSLKVYSYLWYGQFLSHNNLLFLYNYGT